MGWASFYAACVAFHAAMVAAVLAGDLAAKSPAAVPFSLFFGAVSALGLWRSWPRSEGGDR